MKHIQYVAELQSNYDAEQNRWRLAQWYLEDAPRYYTDLAKAKADIEKAITRNHRQFGGNKTRTVTERVGMIGVSHEVTKADDEYYKIRRWRIREQEVTDWELTEQAEV